MIIEKLKKELTEKKKEFKTDNYPMSIGEIKNIYENGEIIINPDFQRLFRWSDLQKVKLIESILLGIPIPPIYVYQRTDGIWEIVDGLQRISTILQFFGVLKKYKKLKLCKTKYLSSLENFVWKKEKDDEIELPQDLKLFFKRSKLNFSIILNESDPTAKYEVFQRLNTGGIFASNQEIRNVVMIMIDREIYNRWIKLSNNYNFLKTINLSERFKKEEYHTELVLRFMSLYKFNFAGYKDVKEFLDDSLEKILKKHNSELNELENIFCKVFEYLNMTYGDKVFKKFNKEKNKFQGRFLTSAFEAISIGLAKNIRNYTKNDINIIKNKVINIWNEPEFTENQGAGTNAQMRLTKIIPFAEKYFNK